MQLEKDGVLILESWPRLCHVVAPKDMTPQQVQAYVNEMNPRDFGESWQLSSEGQFAEVASRLSSRPCEGGAYTLHWLTD
jgi:hypothetical protein